MRVGLTQPWPERAQRAQEPQAMARRWNLRAPGSARSRVGFRLRQAARVAQREDSPAKPPEQQLRPLQAAVSAQERRPELPQEAAALPPQVRAVGKRSKLRSERLWNSPGPKAPQTLCCWNLILPASSRRQPRLRAARPHWELRYGGREPRPRQIQHRSVFPQAPAAAPISETRCRLHNLQLPTGSGLLRSPSLGR